MSAKLACIWPHIAQDYPKLFYCNATPNIFDLRELLYSISSKEHGNTFMGAIYFLVNMATRICLIAHVSSAVL